MRAWLIILAISTAAFAGTTAYLAYELAVERERASLPAAAPYQSSLVSAASSPGTAQTKPSDAPAAATTPAVTTNPDSGVVTRSNSMTEADIKKAQAEYSRRFLAQMADPQQREDTVLERKVQMRHSFPRVEQVLGLTPEQYARFLELQARQQLDMQEAHSRCMVDPACQLRDMRWSPDDFHGDEIASLLGPERMQKFETYKNTMGEREAVSQLKSRLPDSQRLGDDRAEQLITALAQEREALNQEAYRSGSGMTGFGIGAGMVFAPANDRPFEERYEAARQYSQRLRDRAAQYLNAEQQRVFNEMQEDTLLSLRSALRNKDSGGYTAVTVSSGS
jgi:hypothetical protein